jgi:asparagine synthase (glutamine-hydrolysing)
VPFLDHKFVQLAMSIPESIKTKNGSLKYILKKAVRGVIPDDLIDRKKQGFGVPMAEWSAGRLGEYARAELEEFCDAVNILSKPGVLQLFEKNRRRELWILLNVALWWKHYVGCDRSVPTMV